jgi:hypothetical protein
MSAPPQHYDPAHGCACPALPCPALPCPALPCPALPCPALPCPALPCPALFNTMLRPCDKPQLRQRAPQPSSAAVEGPARFDPSGPAKHPSMAASTRAATAPMQMTAQATVPSQGKLAHQVGLRGRLFVNQQAQHSARYACSTRPTPVGVSSSGVASTHLSQTCYHGAT